MAKLGETLVNSKLIDEDQFNKALEYSRMHGCKLGHAIAELNFATELDIALAISEQIKIPYINIFSQDFSDAEVKKAGEKLIRKLKAIPIKRTKNTLEVAMSDPLDLDVISEIQFALGCKVKPLLALESEIDAFIRQYYSGGVIARDNANLAKFELVKQRSVGEKVAKQLDQQGTGEDAAKQQIPQSVKELVFLLMKKGVLSVEEAGHFLD